MPFGPGGIPAGMKKKGGAGRPRAGAAGMRWKNPKSRTPEQRELDLARESDMYFGRAMTIHSIAKEIGVSGTQIYRDLILIRRRAQAAIVKPVEELKTEMVTALRYIQNEALQAWDRSQEDSEAIETTERVSDVINGKNALRRVGGKLIHPAKKKTKATVMKREGQVGDARFLECARKCVDDIGLILGVNVPLVQDGVDQMKAQDDAHQLLEGRLKQLHAAVVPPNQPATTQAGAPAGEQPATSKAETVN